MKKIVFLIITLINLIFIFAWKNSGTAISTEGEVRLYILNELTSIKDNLFESKAHINNIDSLQRFYYIARKHYKHSEFFIEYCSPREAKYIINGPLVPKHDPEFGSAVVYPQGFQRIEELLFDNDGKIDTAALFKEYDLLFNQIESLSSYYKEIEIEQGKILEMCQLELVRIATMNLSGYDATIVQNNVTEALWSIEGIEKIINLFNAYTENFPVSLAPFQKITKTIATCKKFLKAKTDYNSFDRLNFITKCVSKLNKELISFHNACQLPWDDRKFALDLKQDFLFGKNSFNKQYFSIYYDDTLNLYEQAALGKELFFEPLLSGNNLKSCASCHNPDIAFSDGKVKSEAFNKTQMLDRNSPTLINVIYQKAFFHDGRVYQLEQQIFDVVHNQNEMNSNFDDVVIKLKQSVKYKNHFKKAFSGTVDTSITSYSIQKAITEYEKTLISFNSRFDNYLRGNTKSLTQKEINGYNLFAGKALCGSCHFFPLFNGTVPPFYNDSEFEVIGVAKSKDNKELDEDLGRFNITKLEEQRHAFKTPTVRNVELTSPYMHNGVYKTLEEVVEFYHKGGGKGFGYPVPNQTLPFDSLKLSPSEKDEIVLFMKSLTDKDYLKIGK